MEVHICRNCKYEEKCNNRWNESFLYCMSSNTKIRNERNQEFLSESMIIDKSKLLKGV